MAYSTKPNTSLNSTSLCWTQLFITANFSMQVACSSTPTAWDTMAFCSLCSASSGAPLRCFSQDAPPGGALCLLYSRSAAWTSKARRSLLRRLSTSAFEHVSCSRRSWTRFAILEARSTLMSRCRSSKGFCTSEASAAARPMSATLTLPHAIKMSRIRCCTSGSSFASALSSAVPLPNILPRLCWRREPVSDRMSTMLRTASLKHWHVSACLFASCSPGFMSAAVPLRARTGTGAAPGRPRRLRAAAAPGGSASACYLGH
mmetsp:Transcript_51341/g.144669  ORF Transcript_51341/g.144669 Transcript_51341/m.144669 type:complete len:260 (-) Transcript_51341:29-808(-)